VRWVDRSGGVQEARGEIVVGADGRRSSICAQAGIPLEVDPPPHFVAGMLVEGIEGIEAGVNLHARESDLLWANEASPPRTPKSEPPATGTSAGTTSSRS
jgi:flavin-dependent dehydrogenase